MYIGQVVDRKFGLSVDQVNGQPDVVAGVIQIVEPFDFFLLLHTRGQLVRLQDDFRESELGEDTFDAIVGTVITWA